MLQPEPRARRRPGDVAAGLAGGVMTRPDAGQGIVRSDLTSALDPLPHDLLDEPLRFLVAEHLRQRGLCQLLRHHAITRQIDRATADRIVAFLARDLPLHHLDEERDLFPAVLKGVLPDDNLGPILARLGDDHRHSVAHVEAIVAALTAEPARDVIAIPPRLAEVMLAYATSEHRHLSVENGIVLVIASKRLTAADLGEIAQAMKARRGVVV